MTAQHILGWIFLLPASLLWSFAAAAEVFLEIGGHKKVEGDWSILKNWAIGGGFATAFCYVEGWL